MKSIAVIACCDTKFPEVDFVCKMIKRLNHKPLLIDVSTSKGFTAKVDIARERVAAEIGVDWKDVENSPKHELLDIMCRGSAALVSRLYKEGALDGILSIGGLQNTNIGTSAMRALPIGVPKLMVSTVATGQRTFDMFVGTKDVTIMPAISDFAGLNIVSETILSNAVGALVGMVEYAGRELPQSKTTVIGTTLMGATNDGVVQAVKYLQDRGHHVVSFHSTGAGGKAMEELIENGIITAAMDLTLHEVVYEYFGFGFGYGADKRLEQGAQKGIPMVVCPGGIDFMCQWKNQLFDDVDKRKMIWHNATLAHVKLTISEVTDISRIIVSRLNKAKGKVVVIIPTQGLRTFTKKGQPLYDPDVDNAIIDVFKNELRRDIPLKLIDANLIDKEFSEFAAKEMIELIKNIP